MNLIGRERRATAEGEGEVGGGILTVVIIIVAVDLMEAEEQKDNNTRVDVGFRFVPVVLCSVSAEEYFTQKSFINR